VPVATCLLPLIEITSLDIRCFSPFDGRFPDWTAFKCIAHWHSPLQAVDGDDDNDFYKTEIQYQKKNAMKSHGHVEGLIIGAYYCISVVTR
jgi:hypothetical protein